MDNDDPNDTTLTLDEAMTLIGISYREIESVHEHDEPRWDGVRRAYVLGEDDDTGTER